MKMSGAKPSHPIEPEVCAAKRCSAFMRIADPFTAHSWARCLRRSGPVHLPREFSCIQAGHSKAQKPGGTELRFWSRPQLRKRLWSCSKSNRMTHSFHGVKVEAQVVDGI